MKWLFKVGTSKIVSLITVNFIYFKIQMYLKQCYTLSCEELIFFSFYNIVIFLHLLTMSMINIMYTNTLEGNSIITHLNFLLQGVSKQFSYFLLTYWKLSRPVSNFMNFQVINLSLAKMYRDFLHLFIMNTIKYYT